MSQEDSHRMTPRERQDWSERRAGGARPCAPAEGKPPKKASKLSQAAKNDMALSAAKAGDLAGVKAAFELGASPNARERALPRRSLLEASGDGGSDATMLAILAAGGRVAPRQSQAADKLSEAFDKARDGEGFDQNKELASHVKKATFHLGLARAREWGTIKAFREALQPELSDDGLAALCAASLRWDLAYAGFLEGAGLRRAWSKRSEVIERTLCAQSPQNVCDRAALTQALGDPKAVDHMDAPSGEKLYQWALQWSDGALVNALLDAGLRPSSDWTVPWGGARVSALIQAAKAEAPGAFDVLKRCPAAVEAAKNSPFSPKAVRMVSVTRLLELAALGVGVDAWCPKEGNILHAWAEIDCLPRAGWASLARAMPQLFSQTDRNGETGVEKMRKKLRSQRVKDEFDASLGRAEGREIRAVAAPSKTKKTGKSRL